MEDILLFDYFSTFFWPWMFLGLVNSSAQLIGAVMGCWSLSGHAGLGRKAAASWAFCPLLFHQPGAFFSSFFGILKWRCQTRRWLWRRSGASVQSLGLWSAGAHGATGVLTTPDLWPLTKQTPLSCSLNSLAHRSSVSVIHGLPFESYATFWPWPAAGFCCLWRGIKTQAENMKFTREGDRAWQTWRQWNVSNIWSD